MKNNTVPPMDRTFILERARRVKTARLLSCQPRVSFEHHGIKSATLRSWEDPKYSKGISLKGAKRLVQALILEGIYCSTEWLLEGKGPPATLIAEAPKDPSQDWHGAWSVLSEIELFKQNNPHAIVTLVPDDSMLPFYDPGDHVGGIWQEGPAIRQCLNHRCIVLTQDYGSLIRVLSENKVGYSLNCTNPQSTANHSMLFEVKILKCAEIIWHRKSARL